MCNLSGDVNNTPKTNAQRCKIIPSQNEYSEMYKGTTEKIQV